ncbi:N-acylglucosamine 2-epimerase [Spirochaetia bacterium]|nr:N-acylglucosamine 2-epimerase [Spirochaetia bacterium]
MKELAGLYRDELLNNVIPFWLNHSIDREYGGYLTSLDRDGSVFDTDKWTWMQGREVWMFATLYNKVEKRREWLDASIQGAEFLNKYAHNEEGYYFCLNRQGQPLVQPYNIFSNCFPAMGYGALAVALPDSEYPKLTKTTFDLYLSRRDNPKGRYNKIVPGARPLKSFAITMMLSNMALEMEASLGSAYVDELVKGLAKDILGTYYKPEFGCILEQVGADGSFVDSYDGRVLSPGHACEAMWFLMDVGVRLGDKVLIRQAADIVLKSLERGWDKEFGGIFYYMDVKGKYPLWLDCDQKHWWVHLESLIACAKAFHLTGDEQFKDWFMKLHDYTWKHFKDPEYPEWFGYLNRRGEILFPLKGGKFKGCFHLPRALLQIWRILESL